MQYLWLVAGIALVVAEVMTVAFGFVMFAAGAFAAAAVAALGANFAWQAAVFVLVSTFALVLVRPGLLRYMHRNSDKTPMGVDTIEGSTALVLETIDAEHGLVKIDGEMWSARAYDVQQVIDAGERVRVIRVEGATVMVWRD